LTSGGRSSTRRTSRRSRPGPGEHTKSDGGRSAPGTLGAPMAPRQAWEARGGVCGAAAALAIAG
jgi:hypothetical protein